MKIKNILFAAAFFIALCSYGQDDQAVVKTLLEQANDMGKKFVEKDYSAFLKYSHPATIKTMGGEQQTLYKLKQEMQSITEDGITITNISFGAPSKIIKVDKELQCTVPQIMVMRVPNGKITATTTMIAISQDNGRNWSFLDTANYNHYDMKMLLPTLSDEIIIPERSDPSFEEDFNTQQ